ncbi:MAG: ribosomal-processing cysteine protease Prp [Clostridia bacterium]
MIRAIFWDTSKNKHIEKFQIEGHADYAEYGQDIVCAAVSALTITIINAMTEILKVSVEYTEQDGNIICEIPSLNNDEKNSKIQLLAHTLLMGLEDIANEYTDSIEIKTITK